MAASGLVFRSDLVGTGRAISIPFGINGVQKLIVMLIPVDKISVLQPFDPELWETFHSKAPGT